MHAGTGGKGHLFQGNSGNKDQILRGTWEQSHYWGTGNIREEIFDFCGTVAHANLFQGNRYLLGGPQL